MPDGDLRSRRCGIRQHQMTGQPCSPELPDRTHPIRTPLQRKTHGESPQPEVAAQAMRPPPDHAARIAHARPSPPTKIAQNHFFQSPAAASAEEKPDTSSEPS